MTSPIKYLLGVSLSVSLSVLAWGQATTPAVRIQRAVDNSQRVVLRGNVHPLARAANDRGAAPGNLALHSMLLLLKRSPEQELALRQLIEDQHTPDSPRYHQWLTPAQFGQRFGVAPADIATVTQWLQSQGFTVDRVNTATDLIEFSGTAAAVAQGLHTAIHRYNVNGVAHWANATDPEIPAALAPVVSGVVSLNNFLKHAGRKRGQGQGLRPLTGGPVPSLTFTDNNGNPGHALAPGDFAVLYNVAPLYSASPAIDGQGETIAVVGRSDVDPNDISDFRKLFVPSNSANLPQVIVNGPDPGDTGGDDESEADLDVEWSGAIAPNATIDFVVSSSTDTTDGVDLSAEYIVDHNLAPIMTTSFAACEAQLGSSEDQFIESIYEQAAAQGITVIDSSGDTGVAGCDPNDGSEAAATQGLGVSGLASTPFNVAVGGTEFNEGSGTFWSATNDPSTHASVLSPIPEEVWNESCLNASCNQSGPLSASGGGQSLLYTKPAWQFTSIPGVANDNTRDVPDIAFSAAGHDGYVVCQGRSCEPNGQGAFAFEVFGGTSASAPSFAGVMALVEQKTNAIQGQANYTLYALARNESWTACNSATGTQASLANCVFLDTTTGNNSVPCASGSSNCTNGTLTGFKAGVGYDMATGLGSINVTNLVNGWAAATPSLASATTLSVNPTTFTHGQGVTLNVTVTQQNGSIGPSGDVAFIAETGSSTGQGVDFGTITLGGPNCGTKGCVSGTENGLPGGTYNVVARYSGDASFAPSLSNPVKVTVAPENSVTGVGVFGFDQLGNESQVATAPYGSFLELDAFVGGAAGAANTTGCNNGTTACINDGVPVGVVSFLNNGSALSIPGVSSTIALNTEGEANIPNGVTNLAPGSYSLTGAFTPSTSDPNGAASFNASTSAAVALTITPATTSTTITNDTLTGTSLALKVAVTTQSLGNPPTGTVNFFSGSTQIGSAAVQGSTGPTGVASATASATIASVPNGTDSITAVYAGDANYATSTSPAVTVTVGASGGGFTMTASPTTATISGGQSDVVTLTLTPNNGFNGTVTLSCTGAPASIPCSFSPASVALSGAAASSTLTLAAPAGSQLPAAPGPRWPQFLLLYAALLALATAALGSIFWTGARRRLCRWSVPAALTLFALSAAACGGGGSASNHSQAANYTITVNATSGSVTASQVITLTVN